MRRNYKLERLQNGESFVTSEKGNSMVPLIKSGQEHMLEPCSWEEAEVGDIVYCKVRGNWYTHLVTAKNDKRGCQISNNSGYVNGWTKAVYGVVTEVIGGKYKRKIKTRNMLSEIEKRALEARLHAYNDVMELIKADLDNDELETEVENRIELITQTLSNE